MPGNEVGERVHNFFAQDNVSQGQYHSQVVDGNWPALNNNPWVGSQRQVGLLSSNTKSSNLQHSDTGREQSSHSLNEPHGLNFSQPILRTDFTKSQPPSQHSNLNGYMYGNRLYQGRQDEANFLAVDSDSDQRNLNSRGLSFYESQGGTENQTRAIGRSESSEMPVSFDLFGGQQHMSRHQPSMMQSLQRQPSGLSDMPQLQQQVMFMKMQEIQRQQQLQQLDARQNNQINQIPTFAKQASGSHPASLINGNPNTDTLNYPWTTEVGGTNWVQRGSPVLQGSSNGPIFSPNHGQTQRMMGVIPQQVESLYGVPVSSSRGSGNQYPQMVMDKQAMQQMTAINSPLPGNQYAGLPDQVNMQDGTFISRQRFQGENVFAHNSGQALNNSLNNLQQVNSIRRSVPLQEFRGRQVVGVTVEALQEKPVSPVDPPGNDVGLDPTEEKILFGSDDNIWAAFGKSSNLSGEASNLFDGGALMNGFPSIQSGTWSALMQSAVAETSSSDIGLQEEWSGLNFPSADVPLGNQNPANFSAGSRQQASLPDEDMAMASSLNSGSVPPSGSININHNYQSALGFQQVGHRFPFSPGQNFQATSQRHIQSSEEENKWSNFSALQKSVAEGAPPVYGNASHSLDANANIKSVSGHLVNEQSGFRQPCDKLNSWNTFGSANATVNTNESDNSSQHSHGNDQKRVVHGEIVRGGLWKSSPAPGSTIDQAPMKSSVGSPQLNTEGFSLNNAVAAPKPNAMKAGEESSQIPNNQHFNHWRDVNPSVKVRGNEGFGRIHRHLNKDNQVMDASLNSSDKEIKTVETENSDKKENSNDSYRSNLSQRNFAHGVKDHKLSDATDSRPFSSGKQKPNNQVGRKMSASRKFQYHPMGNVDEDVEPPYGVKHPMHSQAMLLQNTHFGQSKFTGQIPKDSMELGKGQSHDLQGDGKNFGEVPSQTSIASPVPNMSVPFSRSIDTGAPNKSSQSSPNMLELLQKVDQSKEHGASMPLNSSERNASSEMPAGENFDGSIGRLQRTQSSASQGFGLQLGPPSQRMPISNHPLPSQGTLQTVISSHSSVSGIEVGEKGQVQLVPTSFVQSLPSSSDKSQEEFEINRSGVPGQSVTETFQYKMPGNLPSVFSTGFPYSRSPLQDHHAVMAGGQILKNQYSSLSLEKHGRHPIGQSTEISLPDAAGSSGADNPGSSGAKSQEAIANNMRGVSASQIQAGDLAPASQPLTVSGIPQQGAPQKMSPNMWTNLSAHQNLFVSPFRKISSNSSLPLQSNILESTSIPHNQGEQNAKQGGSFPSEFGASHINSQGSNGEENPAKESLCHQVSCGSIGPIKKMNESQGKESVVKNQSDGSPANSASSQKDIVAFGRTLEPNNFAHQNYSLLNQMRAMKNTEPDPNNRLLKRMKGSDGGQQLAARTVSSNSTVPHTLGPSGDPRMLSFAGPADSSETNASSSQGNAASQDTHAFGQDESQSNSHCNNATAVKAEYSRVSPQMAPSWFNQYGTFKNGRILPMYDARKSSMIKTAEEQPFTLGKTPSGLQTLDTTHQLAAVAVDASQVGNIRQNLSVAIDHFSSSQTVPPNVSGEDLITLRPKKRKTCTAELKPWHKEVSQGSHNLQSISTAEVNWVRAASRLIEKVEDDIDLIEDGPPMLRPKRRLILTTQLMQQLFHAPPAAVLYADANSDSEGLVYSASRAALGDACSLVSCSSNDSDVPRDGKSLTHERNSDQHLLDDMEEFMERATKLESDFLRLDKRASVVDLIVECQDLEKFSVINRFAKFHGRAQTDNADASSSDAAANAQKPFPQRYVTALPMPRNLPIRVQCLSL